MSIIKKYAVLALSTLIIFGGCTPSNPNPNNQTTSICPQPKLSFKGNGVLYECNAVADSRLGWLGYPRFFKYGSGMNHELTFCNFKDLDNSYSDEGSWVVNYPITQNTVYGSIRLSSNNAILSIGTYTNYHMVMNFISLGYSYVVNSNAITLNITSLNNGLASGSFSGILPSGTGTPNDGPLMTITDGVFSNIPVLE